LPRFFDEIAAGNALDVDDAARDPRTAEVYRVTMAPLGTRALASIPIRRHGRAVGAIALHDPADVADARHCLRILASMAARRAGDTAAGSRAAEEEEEAGPVMEPATTHTVATDLRRADAAALGEALYPEVAVLAMCIDDEALAVDGD